MKLFKNYKTKKQLRKEIEELKSLCNAAPIVTRQEVKTIKIVARASFSHPVSAAAQKVNCMAKLLEELDKYIKWERERTEDNVIVSDLIATIEIVDRRQ